MIQDIEKVVGKNGCVFVNNGTVARGKFYAFVPNIESVIDTIILQHGNTTSIKSDFSGVTLGQGMYVPAGSQEHPDAIMTSILLSIGNGIAYMI